MKKRILILRSAIGVFGAERVILELSQALPTGAFEPIVGVIENRHTASLELAHHAQRLGLRAEVFRCRRPFDPATVAAIRRYIRRNEIDIIHAHGYKANFYASMGALFSGIPCIATCHPWTETGYSLRARIYTFLDKMWVKRMDYIVAVSEEVRQQLQQRYPAREIHLIPNGIETGRFNGQVQGSNLRQKLGLSDSDQVLGTIGRLVPEKGYRFLLDSVAELSPRHPDMKLILVGDGPLREELARQTERLQLQSRVRFLGVREDIPELLGAMDIFVLSSLSEGLPMVLLEAMAATRPIIATQVGEIANIIVHGTDGMLVPPADAPALSRALDSLLQNKKEALRMAHAAQQKVRSHYTASAMAEKYGQLYQRVSA